MTDHHDFEKSQVEYWMEKICSDVGWMQCWTLFGLQAATCGMPFGREISELKMRHLFTGGVGGGLRSGMQQSLWAFQGCLWPPVLLLPLSLSPLPLPPPHHHPQCDHTLCLFTFPWPIAHQRGSERGATRFSFWKMKLWLHFHWSSLLQHYWRPHHYTCWLFH